MGCRSSRPDAADITPAAVLCRERRDLLRAAADRRDDLAAAHAAYFRALPRVADALSRFAHHHLTASSPPPPQSPVLTLPPSNHDEPKKPTSSTPTSTLPSGSGHSHLHFHSDASDSDPDAGDGEISPQIDPIQEPAGRSEMPWEFTSYPWSPNVTIPNYYYMKTNSIPPNTVYQEPSVNFTNVAYMGYNYGYNNPMYGVPVAPERDREAEAPPPPMPMPEVSPWDFFNPFDSYEQGLSGYDQGKAYGVGSVTSSLNSSEVREREGIPELEEETEQESMRGAVAGGASTRIVDGGVNAKASVEHKEDEIESVGSTSVIESGAESVCSCECSSNAGGGASSVEEAQVKVQRVSSEKEDSSLVVDDGVPSKARGTRDVTAVVEEIKEQFNSVASCGEDVARILEVGRMRYRSRSRVLRLILSRIIGTIALLFSTLSEPSVKNSEHSAANAPKRNQDLDKSLGSISDIELNTLSSIMDRLYVWEKRLHKEVKEEEKLRIMYDREWKRLKALDDSGAEAYKIDSTQASIRSLLTRININIRAAKVISRRIHKLRDDELQPHLIELIQGLVRMWKFVLDCHHRQFQAILETKSHSLLPRTGTERSSSKATLELEMELLNWCSCFRNWILSQKAYIETLNGWLVKWLPQEKEKTSDGIAPFSPGRIGAPAVFITANDWYQTMKRISEGGVIDAMQAFAINVHRLWERQDEEQQQKLKADYLSRDFAKRLKSLQKEHGMHGHLDGDKTALPITNSDGTFDDCMVALDALQKRLDEEKANHEATVKQVLEASATDLKAGLAPIFEALESFTQETLKGYENVRIPNGGGVT